MEQGSFEKFQLFDPSEEHKMLRQTVRDFVQKEVEPQAEESDKREFFNLQLLKKMGPLGLLGITVPVELGGSGMDALAAVITHEELSYSDPGFALAYLAHSMLCANNLAQNGSKELNLRIQPKLCSGEWIGAMGMSEPHVGTDVMGMKTTARLDEKNYVINGRKMWITNGAVDDKGTPADCVLVYAVTGTLGKKPQISTFLVEKGFRGYSVGQKINGKLGMRASNTAELVFDDCRVPTANRVGAEGESLIHMMKNLEIERLTLAAMGIGLARRSLDVMIQYSKERTAFGRSLHKFGQIQKHLADGFAKYRACKTYVYDTARRVNLSKPGNRLDSDGAKLIASEMAKSVADSAIQVLGGYGYVSEYKVERLWRDAKLLEIGGGTSEAHQKNISADLIKLSNLVS